MLFNIFGKNRDPKPPGQVPEPMARVNDDDGITLHQMYESALVLGGIGSGKTSGPGDYLARFLLEQGCGIIWLAAKRDEAERGLRLSRQCGREKDVIHIHRDSGHVFQFLDYELRADGGGVQSAGQLLSDLLRFSSRADPAASKEPFWHLSGARLLKNCLAVTTMGKGTCSVEDISKMVASLPENADKLHSEEWRQSPCACALRDAGRRHTTERLKHYLEYFMEEVPGWGDSMRAGILAQAILTLDPFMSGDLVGLVQGESNVTPDALLHRKIIILDTPTLTYREAGKSYQTTWKLATQRLALRRDVNRFPTPIAIIQDECQEFALPDNDAACMAVGRSARLINLCMTQNIPILTTALGGAEKSKETYAWISNFGTKIFCANHEPETNEFASNLCGHSRHLFMNGSPGGAMHNFDVVDDFMCEDKGGSIGFSEQWHPDVPPEHLYTMAKGGPQFDYTVTGIVVQSGRRWSNGKTWTVGEWNQRR